MFKFYQNYNLSKKSFTKIKITKFPIHNIVIRYISFLLTPFFMIFNLSPNQVSYIRLIVAIVSLYIIARGYYFEGILLLYLSFIIDCVDGNISRIKNKASYFGKYFDGFGDAVVDIVTPIALLFYFFDNFIYENSFLIFLVVSATISSSLSYLVIDKSHNYLRWILIKEKKSLKIVPVLTKKSAIIFINLFEDLKFIALFLSIFLFKPQMFVIYILASIVMNIFRIFGCLIWSRKNLNIRRISSHSR